MTSAAARQNEVVSASGRLQTVELPALRRRVRAREAQEEVVAPKPSEAAVGLQSVQSDFVLPSMELLDELPPDDPDAVRSRRDLRMINAMMRG